MALTKIDKSLLETTSGTADASTFLTGDGTWAEVDAGGGFLGYVVYTGSGTYTPGTSGHADVTKIVVEVQGAGGSGGKGNTSTQAFGGGGAGGYARKFLSMTGITTAAVTVGLGGASMDTYDTAGNAGGLSKFEKDTGSGSFTDVIGNGGGGGVYSIFGRTAGATGTGGDVNIQGGDGMAGGASEWGGSSQFGQGGHNLWNGQLTTSTASGYGSGGGGGYQTPSAAGANGIVIIWEYK